jgi:predicted nicotinamide N-methyase
MAGVAAMLGRYETQEYRIAVAGRELRVLGPKYPHALHYDPLAQTRWEQDGYKPYWAQPWPAAVMLVEHVLRQGPASAAPILELGAGLGIAGLALTQAGRRVVITDYDEDALEFVRASARLNGLDVHAVRTLDWRGPPPETYPLVVASDVLYGRRHHESLVKLLLSCLPAGGQAFLSDPNREEAEAFPALARAHGLTCHAATTQAQAIPGFDARDGRVFAGRVFCCTQPALPVC